jgi:hypothetical protein
MAKAIDIIIPKCQRIDALGEPSAFKIWMYA